MQIDAFTSLFELFAHRAAPIAVSGLWQGLALAFALFLCLKWAGSVSAAQRFVLWSIGFLASVALPLAPLVFSLSLGHSAEPFAATAPHPWLQFDARWMLVLAAVWLIASAARAADLVFHVVRLWRLWRAATPVNVATSRQHKRSFRVCSTQWLDRPSVIGFVAPRVLVPDWLLQRLTPEELNQIVLHESTHLARFDDWTNLLQKLCLVVFPLNLGLLWIDCQLAKEREMACDEAVVRITQAPRAYAACLASLAERGMTHRREALSLGAWQRRSELVSRVHRILRGHPGLPPATARLLLGAFGCGLLVVALELARCPQLVAFVPPTHADNASVRNVSAEVGDAVYPTDPKRATLTHGARMLQTRAAMPTASIAKSLATGRAARKNHVEGMLRAAASEEGADVRVFESRQVIESRVDTEAPQEAIVFTAWEEIETRGPVSRTAVADYDAQPATDASPATQPIGPAKDSAAGHASTKPARNAAQHRTTVTQLVLRVVPRSSESTQPIAIPLGWFVIQL
jgi:beta-lactamase regulating signal transducer with metallopeptidase domain